ncbi:MAG: SLBB domain-containing protein [Candidatus Riflebacteria bacterium]|nr:SLBB domain-containing protein [Candidatus Riflebacteria bacterium]
MKRFVTLCILVLFTASGLWAQSPFQGSRFGGSGETARPSVLDHTGQSLTDVEAQANLPKTDSGAIDKKSGEYYKWRLQQLQRSLYEKTRQEVVKEKSVETSLTREEMTKRRFNELKGRNQERKEQVPESEIEDEVHKRLGSEIILEKFGKAFFDEGEMAQATLFTGATPSNYQLGPGDGLKMIVWSDLGDETVYDVQVNPEGQVYVPILGILAVSGHTVGEFEQTVLGRLSDKFKHFKGQVTLTKVRTIQIFVVGEVEKPGAMTASGLATAFTALYQAGGPTERGSMRLIKVLDDSGNAKEIDLYRYLLSGDRSQDIPLTNGDTVFVPTVSAQVSISGMVTRPAIYEIKENTSLAQSLLMAGNVQARAYSGRVKVTRWSGDKRRQTYDISLNDQAELERFMLMNGDDVIVERAIEKVGNQVAIEGSITRPGEYAWVAGMRVSDLIARAGGIVKEETSLEHGQIIRKSVAGKEEQLAFNVKFALLDDKEQNLELQPLDLVTLLAERDVVAETRFVNIDGAVRRPGQYVYRDGMKLVDLVMNARGLSIDASGDVEVARAGTGRNNEIIAANASNALVHADSTDNISLQPLDRVSVQARGDTLLEAEVVLIKGQVRRPGPYALKHRGEKLSSLIERAGGLTSDAFADGTVFMRRTEHLTTDKQLETAENVQEEMFRQATLDLRADLLRSGAKLEAAGNVKSAVSGDTVAQQIVTFNRSSSDQSVAKSSAEKETSGFGDIEMRSRINDRQMMRIPIPLGEILSGKAREFEDLALLDGDQITIPIMPKTVSVLGAVVNPTTILYNNNRDAGYYINRSGGFSAHSDHRRTVIVKANGEVMAMRNVRRIGRGDIILVPPKPRLVRPDKLKEFSNLATILGNLAITYKVANDVKN